MRIVTHISIPKTDKKVGDKFSIKYAYILDKGVVSRAYYTVDVILVKIHQSPVMAKYEETGEMIPFVYECNIPPIKSRTFLFNKI